MNITQVIRRTLGIDALADAMRLLLIQGKENMRTLAEALAEVRETRGAVESLSKYTASLKEQILARIAAGLSPQQQADLNAIFDEAEAIKHGAVEAITANPIEWPSQAPTAAPALEAVPTPVAAPEVAPVAAPSSPAPVQGMGQAAPPAGSQS